MALEEGWKEPVSLIDHGILLSNNAAGEICQLSMFDSILAHTEEGKKELLFLSNRNPGLLERLCAYL